MKKIILFTILCLWMSTNGYASSCAEGTEITGKNGHVYCKSNVTMNWYTAFAWCDTQGRDLATMEQMCDIDETQRWDGNFGTGKCLNLVGATSQDNWSWSAIPYGSSTAFSVILSTGNVNYRNRTLNYYCAMCW